jgi:hypothetical protein
LYNTEELPLILLGIWPYSGFTAGAGELAGRACRAARGGARTGVSRRALPPAPCPALAGCWLLGGAARGVAREGTIR